MSAVAAAADALVGVRFRLHGRDPVHGLDCVGVVAVSLAAGGCSAIVPSGYALRGGDPAAVIARINALLPRGDGEGAVLLITTGPGQLHLAVRVVGGIVHADAGLRRVVMRPGSLPWPLLASWKT